MTHFDLVPGKTYRIRLTDGSWTDGRFRHVRTTNWLRSRNVTHFMFVNERTGRDIEIKSRQRIRPAFTEVRPGYSSNYPEVTNG